MVSGVGPAETLKQFNIPVVAEANGVGQGMWVREISAYFVTVKSC